MFTYMTEGGAVASGALYYDFNHAVKLILKREPNEIAESTGIEFDAEKSCFSFISLGQRITVTYPDFKVELAETGKTPVVNWRMPILHHLSEADGFPLSGNLVPFRYINEHTAHPDNFEKDTGLRLLEYFDDKPAEKLREACAVLGGEMIKGSGDLFVRFDFLPRVAVFLKLWYSDEETPGSCKFLFDEKCTHYLDEMDVQMCGPLLAGFIIKQYELTEV